MSALEGAPLRVHASNVLERQAGDEGRHVMIHKRLASRFRQNVSGALLVVLFAGVVVSMSPRR